MSALRRSTDPIVLSSRVRLARNLDGMPFRGAISPDQARQFCRTCEAHLVPAGFDVVGRELDPDLALRSDALELPQDLIDIVTPWRAFSRADAGVLTLASDHLRLWAARPGMDLSGCLADVAELETACLPLGPWSKDPQWGWRTASPEDVGTGLRAGVLLHVPALWLSRRLSSLLEGAEVLGFRVVSPWHGDEPGALIVVSNRRTLGPKERDLIQTVHQFASRIREEEEKAAQDLVSHWGGELRDSVHRSDALLGACRLLSASELAQRAALVALGSRTGWLPPDRSERSLRLVMGTRESTLVRRQSAGLAESHPHRDDLRAEETRSLWSSAR